MTETIRHNGALYLKASGLTVRELLRAAQAANALIDYCDRVYFAGDLADHDDKLQRLLSDHAGAANDAANALNAIRGAGK